MYNYDFKHNFIGAFSNINWYKNNFKINAGIHLNNFVRRHIGSERSIGNLYKNHGYKNEFSSFIKIKYTLNKFNLFADLQYRYTDFDYEGSIGFDKIKWNFINPKASINYFVSDKVSLYYSFGTCGREPTRNDLFNGEDNLPSDSVGNPIYSNISPEYVNNHEFGLKIKKEKWHLYSNLYLMSFENEIVLNGQYGPNGLPLHSNVAMSIRSGIELDFKIDVIKGIYYQNNTSLSYNRISENNIEFQPILTPGFILNQSIAYKSETLKLGISSKYQEQAFIDFENKNTMPSFFVLGIFSSYNTNP